ncbi:MAG: hypothetical protein O3A85_11595, partial [Proteobacteria bacterium]|nr:hypothetical protein [Pseudomonadota bacterium]
SAIDVTANGLAKALSGISKPPALIWEDVLSPVDWPLWKRLLSTGSIATAADETATDAARQSNERTA